MTPSCFTSRGISYTHDPETGLVDVTNAAGRLQYQFFVTHQQWFALLGSTRRHAIEHGHAYIISESPPHARQDVQDDQRHANVDGPE